MDIKWIDGEGNVLNADNEKIKYLTSDNIKTVIKKEEVKKITIEDGMMNVFKDFENDLELTVVIPKGNKRNAKKIFNEYDRTGRLLKRNSGNFFVDLILDSSVVTFNPFTGILVIFTAIICLFTILVSVPIFILGEDLGLLVSRILIIGAIVYTIISYIWLRIKRKSLKEYY